MTALRAKDSLLVGDRQGRFRRFLVVAALLAAGLLLGLTPTPSDAAAGTEMISVNSAGVQGNGDSGATPPFTRGSTISANGRFVAFYSAATNLVTAASIGGVDTNGYPDLFVRDRMLGTTERVSLSSAGVQGNMGAGTILGGSALVGGVSISDDGRFVAFQSESTNLVPGDTNAASDVFLRDRQLATTVLVSADGMGVQGNDNSLAPDISGDGRYVAFSSFASNLVAGDTNGQADVFVRDMTLSVVTLVSVASGGQLASGGGSGQPSISSDGRFVAFGSSAANLVPGDTNSQSDIFLRDRLNSTTVRVNVDSSGAQSTGGTGPESPSISANGRYVVFDSDATNLVPGDTNNASDAFLRDTNLETTERVSVADGGAQASGYDPEVSADGRYVVFTSYDSSLVSPGISPEVFVRDRMLGRTLKVSLSSTGAEPDGGPNQNPTISDSPVLVAFVSGADNLVSGDAGNHFDIFVRDLGDSGVADRVFGQGGSFTSNTCNLGGISVSSLCFPYGVAVDAAGNLYVADATNNRVLEYNTPLTTDRVADRVFGQGGSFTSSIQNLGGLSASSLKGPVGVAVDAAGHLYVADESNSRVLEYDSPLTSQVANRVFGQPNVTSGSCNLGNGLPGPASVSSLCDPVGVAVDGNGNLYVGDMENIRVLEYNTPLTTDTVADRVFGQGGSFTSKTCNLSGISANSLCKPNGVAVDAAGNLYVGDSSGNNRVLEYNTPLTTDTVADRVFGQPNLNSGSCNLGNGEPGPASASSLCNPIGVAVDAAGSLYVADNTNHRVLEYDTPLTSDTVADKVFGQGSFTSGTCNLGGINASSLCSPVGATVDAGNNLYVADEGNSRVLEYHSDLDEDGVPDATDNCPRWYNPAQNLPAWTVLAGDSDCDGFPDSVAAGPHAPESFMGTDPTRHCARTPTANDEPLPDAWPFDFNDDQLAGLQDVTVYSSVFGSHSPGPPYKVRFDLNGDGLIGLTDVTQFSSFFGKRCSP